MAEKYLIVGATGSIGSNLSEQLCLSGNKVHLVGRDESQLKILSEKLNSQYTVTNVLDDGFVEKIKSDLNKKNQEKRKEAKDIFEKLKNKQFTIKKLSTENKELYGSVKPTEISKIIFDENKIEVKPSMIQLKDDIKTLGTFKAEVNLHPEVQVEIKIEVIAAEAA